MQTVTLIKHLAESFVKKNGFKKVDFLDYNISMNRVYYKWKRDLFIEINGISFIFGKDNIFNCTAHICDEHNDCAVDGNDALHALYDYVNGVLTKEEFQDDYFSD